MRGDACISENAMVFPCGMSRTGTTLLTTVLDSHPDVSLGYELIPTPQDGPETLLGYLSETCPQEDLVALGRRLRAEGRRAEGLFFVRAHRAGLAAGQTAEVLRSLLDQGLKRIQSLSERLIVAHEIAACKFRNEGTKLYGFKLNIPSLTAAAKCFPGGRFVYILRDPRDVVASHFRRDFGRSLEQICDAWNGYLRGLETLRRKNPQTVRLIRYEDLVSSPESVLQNVFEMLPLEFDAGMIEFYRSKATVHQAGHPNAESLGQPFFTSSVGRWRRDLGEDQAQEIAELCREAMPRYEYH